MSEERSESRGRPVVPPVVHSTTYRFDSTEDLVDVVEHRSGYIYSRWDNPTVRTAERALAKIEGYDEAVGFGSGMAAITSAILAFTRAGDRVAAIATYGETVRFISDFLPAYGVATCRFGPDETDACRAAIEEGRTLLYLESPMNPLLRVIDVAALAEHAHRRGATVLLDSTFASPVNQRPRDLGVDVTLHSATKYIGGHHDVTAGFALADGARSEAIWRCRRMLGGVLDPSAAFSVWRGLQTMEIRVVRQNETAGRLARWLVDRPGVRRVHYPGLETHPDHAVAVRQMRGFGGMLSFELEADREATARFLDALSVISLATSLGGTSTLATQPVTNTHASMSRAEREAAGISEGLVRLSVGLETFEALSDDIARALRATIE